jgi:hypothetical protein
MRKKINVHLHLKKTKIEKKRTTYDVDIDIGCILIIVSLILPCMNQIFTNYRAQMRRKYAIDWICHHGRERKQSNIAV